MNWESMDDLVSIQEMPEEYKKSVMIICYDCEKKTEVPFHFFGLKCGECGSYNTAL
jgi:RING finger/CHY zinc finger protein 1